MTNNKKKIGEILVEKGIISQATVERILVVSQRNKKRFGLALEELELVTGEELAETLAQQYNLKMVTNISKHAYPKSVLNLVNPEAALKHQVFPLKVDNGRLLVAMADPTDRKYVNTLAVNNMLTIIPIVSTRKDIHAAICKHYYGISAERAVTKTVLIIEDDEFMRTYLKDILVKHDYQVLLAGDGMEGFKEVVAKSPHVIVVDKEMPKLDGYAFMNSVKSLPETNTIPVILISGMLSPEDEAKVFDKGFFDFIPKPISEATLVSRVKRALRYSEQRLCYF